MKRTVLIYGILGGVLIAVLKVVEYRFLVLDHSLEIYGGIVALLFSVLGISLGLKLTRTCETVVVREVRVPVPGALRAERTLALDRIHNISSLSTFAAIVWYRAHRARRYLSTAGLCPRRITRTMCGGPVARRFTRCECRSRHRFQDPSVDLIHSW